MYSMVLTRNRQVRAWYLGMFKTKIRNFPKSRHPIGAPRALFSIICMWPSYCNSVCISGWMEAMQSIATTTDDLENREISARQRFTVFTLIGRMEAEHVARR